MICKLLKIFVLYFLLNSFNSLSALTLNSYYKSFNLPENFIPPHYNFGVTVIDSEIKDKKNINVMKKIFHINKNIHFNENDMIDFQNNLGENNNSFKIQVHGTAIASIIGATRNYPQFSRAFGIFPGIPIVNRIAVPNINALNPFLEAVKAAIFTGNEKIINVSGGYQGSHYQDWHDYLMNVSERNDFLIIAAVGNDNKNIDQTAIESQIWPAAYKPRTTKAKTIDPVIRVGAVMYDTHSIPQHYVNALGGGSRYSPTRVDIVTLGHNVPYLDDNGHFYYANGTSMSTAIVSGVTTILWNCKPTASAQEIKNIIFETADRYEHLSQYVKDGRILNAEKAINKACLFNESNMLHNEHSEENEILDLDNIHQNELKNIPVKWKIDIANKSYKNYTLANHDSLKDYKSRFSVAKKNGNVFFYLTESGQIVTTVGENDAIPLCLTASDINSASWQKIGFMPCRNSLKQFQEWDLNYISSKVAASDSFVFSELKLKNSNTCLRMKNRFIHWGDLFLSHCEEYHEHGYLLSLAFKQTNYGYAKIEPISYEYKKLKVGSKYVSNSFRNYATLYPASDFVFKFDINSLRFIGFIQGINYDYKTYCLVKNDDKNFKNTAIEKIGSNYSYLKILECDDNIQPKEQFYLVTSKRLNNRFYIFSPLEKDRPMTFDDLISFGFQKDRTDENKNLCVGEHKGYLWVGECEKYVREKWQEESSFSFVD